MKHRGFYLKNVYFILSCEDAFLPFEESVIELQKAGVSVMVMPVEEAVTCEAASNSGKWQSGNCLRKNLTAGEATEQLQTLYVTDCEAVAERLLGDGLAVLGYCHEQNAVVGFQGVKYILEAPEGTPTEYFERVLRRYAGLPWSILETDRCYVRESCEEDVEAFYEIYKAPEVTRYTEGLFEYAVSERAYIREYIEKVYAYFEFGVWTVVLKESGKIIGRAGLSLREGFEEPELGYVFGVPWQGKGLAREVCESIIKYAEEELEISGLQVLIQESNEASVRLAQKLGFRKEEDIEIGGKLYIRMQL